MTSNAASQPRHLTLIELVINSAVLGDVGYLVAGWSGFWCGVGVVTIRYVQLVWRAAYSLDEGHNRDRQSDTWP